MNRFNSYHIIILLLIIISQASAQTITTPTYDTTYVNLGLLYSNSLVFARHGFEGDDKDYKEIMKQYSVLENKPEDMSDVQAIVWAAEEGNEFLTDEQKQEQSAWKIISSTKMGYDLISNGRTRSAETNMVIVYKMAVTHGEEGYLDKITVEEAKDADLSKKNLKSLALNFGSKVAGEAAKDQMGMENEFDDIKHKLSFGAEGATEKLIDTKGFNRISKHAASIATDNVALVTAMRGRYNTAEELAQRALTYRKNFFGDDHPATIASYQNLGAIHRNMGKWKEALSELKLSLDKAKNILGTSSYLYSVALNNYSMLMMDMGQLEDASQMLDQAIRIRKELPQDEDETDLKRMFLNRALLLTEMEKYDQAEEIYLTWLDNVQKRKSKKHPDYANLLHDLATLRMRMNKTEGVAELLEEASEIYDKKLNKRDYTHPSFLESRTNLARFYFLNGEYEKAGEILKVVVPQYSNTLQPLHPQLLQANNALATYYWKTGEIEDATDLFKQVADQTLELAYKYFPYMSEQEREKFWVRIKGVINTLYAFTAEKASENPELSSLAYNVHIATKGILLQNSTRIREAILSGADSTTQKLYNEWIKQRDMLSFLYTLPKEDLKEEDVDISELEASVVDLERQLAEKSQAFATSYDTQRKGWNDIRNQLEGNEAVVDIIRVNQTNTKEGIKYLILTGGNENEHPEAILISNGEDLEGKYFKYYSNVMHNQLEDEYSYGIYWEPVAKSIEEKDNIYISLDGIYNKVNIGSLHNGSNFLIESKTFNYLPNNSEIEKVKTRTDEFSGREAVLIGYPDYGKSGKIATLPGTRDEVNRIATLLGRSQISVKKLMENEASEEKIKKLDQPKLLHIATHGFFMEDASGNSEVFGVNINTYNDNPLLRSGLMLAGVEDKTFNRMSAMTGEDDGILTAYEVINLNLQNTELVVLSACETGLGDIKNGEGVYGLLRAFQLAGSDAVVMSLWKVDDEATQYLMTDFYKNLLTTKDKATSFNRAQINTMKKYPHPYYWGAFMLINN